MLKRRGNYFFRFTAFLLLMAASFFAPGCKHHEQLTQLPFHQDSKKDGDGKEPSVDEKRKFDYLYFEGTNAKIKGNTPEALEHFQKCLNIAPNNPAVLYEMADIMHKAGRNTEALSYAKRA